MYKLVFIEPVRAAEYDGEAGQVGLTFITAALLAGVMASDPAAEAALAQQVRDEATRLGLVPT